MPKGKRDPSKPRGRMTAYAYFVQACREERRRNSPEEKLNFIEFTRFCAGRWKVLPEPVKGEFHEMARRDTIRYQREMLGYVPPPTPPPPSDEESGPASSSPGPLPQPKSNKVKVKKDPNAPRRALSAFFWFSQDERPKLKERNPNCPFVEVTKELAKLWAGVDPRSKRMYEELATRDKARYQLELAEYKKNLEERDLQQELTDPDT